MCIGSYYALANLPTNVVLVPTLANVRIRSNEIPT